MNIGIIIQARMGSHRLPGKVLMPIAGKPLLDHILGRLSRLKHKFGIVVATTISKQDDIIVNHCDNSGISTFRGSEVDVLDRYYRCATAYKFDHIVRLTADNPFTDIDELQRLIDFHINNNNDYTHSFTQLPIGVGAEIFTFPALEKSAHSGMAPNHREHVNEYIQENPDLFCIDSLSVRKEKMMPNLRLTIDTKTDYDFVCKLVKHTSSQWINTEEAIKICLRFA